MRSGLAASVKIRALNVCIGSRIYQRGNVILITLPVLPLTLRRPHSTASDILVRIDERVARIEAALQPPISSSERSGSPDSFRRYSHATVTSNSRPKVHLGNLSQYYQHSLSSPHYDLSFRQTTGEAVAARPSLVSFQCPECMQFDSWNDTENFYDDELASEKGLYERMESLRKSPLSDAIIEKLTPRLVWQLQQTFIQSYLQWMPLMELHSFMDHIHRAQESKFAGQSVSTCLSMFAFAISTLSEDQGSMKASLDPELLGLDFLSIGSGMLQSFSPGLKRDLRVLQCRVLFA